MCFRRLLPFFLVLAACECGPAANEPPPAVAPEVSASEVAPSENESEAAEEAPVADLELRQGATLTIEAEEPAAVQALALSPDGASLVAAGWGRRVVLFDVPSRQGREVHRFGDGDDLQVHAAAWSGDAFAVGSFSELRMFSGVGAPAGEVQGRSHSVASVEDGFAVAGRGELRVVDRQGNVLRRADLPNIGSISRAEGLFVSAGEVDQEIVEFDPADLSERGRGTLAGSFPIGAFFGGGTQNIAPYYRELIVFGGRSEQRRINVPAATSDFKGVSVSETWTAAVTDEHVFLIELQSGEVLAVAEVAATGPVLLDGRSRVFVGTAGGVQVFEINGAP